MKASTKKLLNEQIKIILKELEQVDDVKDRVELRIEAVEVIYNISCHDLEDIVPQGKDSIKENKAKEPIVEEPEETVEEEPVIDEEPVEEEIVEENEEEPEEVSMDDIVEAGADLEPDVAADQAIELEQEQVADLNEESSEVIVTNEEGESIDVTEAYNLLNPEIADDFRREYALQIVEYGTLETYKTLNFIEETEDEIIGYKNLVAYWIDTCELETIEYYINYFASNIDVDEETGEETYVGEELHIDFLNSNNIKGFTEYVESILEDQE
jgi:hypothetical protein